jgi:PAS domain S-box-containing protein
MDTEFRPRARTRAIDLAGLAGDGLLSLVLDRTTDGVLLADRDGVIVYVNKPLLRLFGYEAADLLGNTIDMLVPESHRDQHHGHVKKFARSPEERPMGRDDLDIEGRHADGSRFSVDVQLNMLPGSSLVIATVRDMTVQRQSAVDCAIVRIDLANANDRVDRLQSSLDLVIQRLFALGTSIAAGATNEPVLLERLAGATRKIDEIIDTVSSVGGHPTLHRGRQGPWSVAIATDV